MQMREVYTYERGLVASNTLDIDGFKPVNKKCPSELLKRAKGKKLLPHVNNNDETDVVYVVHH